MKSKDKLVTLSIVGIVLLIALMLTATYAYFIVEVYGIGSNINLASDNLDIEVTFTDTSNVTLVNAYTGDSITKTFSVENTGDDIAYYDILFDDLVNNFNNPDDLVYELTGSNGIHIRQRVVPVSESYLASNIFIEEDEIHEFTLIITFLRTDDNQSINMNKTFSTKINVLESKYAPKGNELFAENTLGYKILSEYTPISDVDVDFNTIRSNQLYFTNDTLNGSTVYYFTGDDTLKNNVLFAGLCFKIIRTTEDAGIRLIYSGRANNNSCENVTTDYDESSFNSSTAYNSYLGLKYGSPNSGDYSNEHSNNNNSTILNVLNSWFTNNISSYSSYVKDSLYCNNRQTFSFTHNDIYYTDMGYSNNNTAYNSFYRIENGIINPTLYCETNDLFSVNNTEGNTSLISEIGLITAEEAILSGLNTTISNQSSFLNDGVNFWTMTPAYFYSNHAYNYYINSNGVLSIGDVSTTTYKVRPVITLKQNTVVLEGDGSSSTPYLITR